MQERGKFSGLFYLLVVYIIWGSTYLAIRIAVMPGAGFTPFMLGAMRALVAGAMMIAWAAMLKQRLRPSRGELIVLAGSGVLLWVGGNGLVMFGEQRADSGLAALIIASTPLFTAVIEAVVRRKPPTLRLVGALLIGLAGLGVLGYPVLRSGVHADTFSILALFGASLSWSAGSVWQSLRRPQLSAQASSGYQLLAGGIGFVLMAILTGEPLPTPTPAAWGAWAYLVIFGSVIGFTSFVQVLRLLPIRLAMTYSYVNPIIAVLLGWMILGEQITGWTVAGAVLVLLGVWGVFSAHAHQEAQERSAKLEAEAAE